MDTPPSGFPLVNSVLILSEPFFLKPFPWDLEGHHPLILLSLNHLSPFTVVIFYQVGPSPTTRFSKYRLYGPIPLTDTCC